MKLTIYGHDMDLEDPDEDGYVTDVVVVARVVRPADDGRIEDMAMLSTTGQTTWMIQVGMLVAANDIVQGGEIE